MRCVGDIVYFIVTCTQNTYSMRSGVIEKEIHVDLNPSTYYKITCDSIIYYVPSNKVFDSVAELEEYILWN